MSLRVFSTTWHKSVPGIIAMPATRGAVHHNWISFPERLSRLLPLHATDPAGE